MDKLLEFNEMENLPPADPSVVLKREKTKQNFSQDSYAVNQQNTAPPPALMNISTTGSYIYGPTSYIKLKLSVLQTVGDEVKFDQRGLGNNDPIPVAGSGGSAYNLFKSFNLNDVNGNVLAKNDEVARLVALLTKYQEHENFKNFSQVFGQFSNVDFAVGLEKIYVLPLSLFHPLFASRQLIPSKLLNNANLKLIFANEQDVFVHTVGLFTEYSVKDMQLVLDELTLMDEAEEALNEKIEKEGLKFAYWDWVHTSLSQNLEVIYDLILDVQCAKVSKLVAKMHRNAAPGFDEERKNPYEASEQYLYTNHKLRIGSTEYPDQPVDTVVQSYLQAIEAFHGDGWTNSNIKGKKNKRVQLGIGFDDYASPTSQAVGICYDLENNPSLNVSGLAVNNAKRLNLRVDYTAGGAADRTLDVWLKRLITVEIKSDKNIVNV